MRLAWVSVIDHRRRGLAVAAVRFRSEGIVAGPEVLEGVVVLHAGLIADSGEECPIAADVVDPSRVPHLADGVVGQQIGQQLDMIPMRVAENHSSTFDGYLGCSLLFAYTLRRLGGMVYQCRGKPGPWPLPRHSRWPFAGLSVPARLDKGSVDLLAGALFRGVEVD